MARGQEGHTTASRDAALSGGLWIQRLRSGTQNARQDLLSYPFWEALLDTSVVVKWFVPEEDSEKALDLAVTLSLGRDLAVYDASFLALAHGFRMPLSPADQRMLSRLIRKDGPLSL